MPGQYLGLRLDIDGATVQRNYSLSDTPNGKTYRISVKREPGGLVSNYLHDRVQEGFELDAFAPAGEFTLAQNSPDGSAGLKSRNSGRPGTAACHN